MILRSHLLNLKLRKDDKINMPKISDNIKYFKESAIGKISVMANEYGCINLGEGFPDFDPPKEITDKLKEVCELGPHQYGMSQGSKHFRECLAKKQQKFMGMPVDADENIVVTCGSSEAMMATMITICDRKDKVIVFSPYYENNLTDPVLNGAELIFVPLVPPAFNFDKEILRKAFLEKPKAIIICNPLNPLGKVFTYEELLYISELCIEFDVFAVVDEVYEHIIFPPNKHTYMSSLPGMFERTIICNSLSKTYSITGWRLGYTVAEKSITDAIKRVRTYLSIASPAPLQEAATIGLLFSDEYYDTLSKFYKAKRDMFLNGLKDAGLSFYEPQGTFFVMMDIEKFGYKSDFDFCTMLIKEIGVAAVPGSSFFKEDINNYVRLHFAKKDETLMEAIRRLKKLKNKL